MKMAAVVMHGNSEAMDALEFIRKEVDALYYFRDHYFEARPIDNAHLKLSDVKNELDRTLAVLDNIAETYHGKAEYLMLRGRALNVLPHYSKEAEDLLSKAVKLDPKLAEAWVYLGECYWKNNQIELAKNCFIGSLSHNKHKLAQRNLSMVMRQLGTTPAEKAKNIEESVDMAKQAVQMDIKDGMSWFILGNAYLTKFFACGQNPAVLKQSLSAYQQAEKDTVANCNPDLHFNRATMYQFQEDYDLALIGYARAIALDPTFPEAIEKQHALIKYLSTVSDLVEAKGKMRGKKLQSLIAGLSVESDLGPYGGGSYSNSSGSTIDLHLVSFKDLKPGVNEFKVIIGRVVCSVSVESELIFTFCFVDKEETCFSVTVYNIVHGWGVKIGDSVAIPEPFMKQVDVLHKDQHFRFDNIRVPSPVVLVVNGRKLTGASQAPSTVSLCARSE